MGFDGDARLEYADSLCVGLRSESRLGRSSSTAFTVSSVTVMLPYKRFERTEVSVAIPSELSKLQMGASDEQQQLVLDDEVKYGAVASDAQLSPTKTEDADLEDEVLRDGPPPRLLSPEDT
ncbi:hypothetical protein PF007_g7690 [Phytophthora fragariae]|uniref:Uncharacterized protein n=1 Tax=Phytophthora fragariae TaxID=53985 RepID=A0A6A3SW92_9STRA|nr:hypothetical protein PF007_g7690 [Phytophthora fragariae]